MGVLNQEFMTVFTWTDEEFAVWIAQRDARAAQEIAPGQYIDASEYQPKSSKIHA